MIYVMSDIHGNLVNFESILRQINLQPEDTLYVLGDVIDRYRDGIKVLRRIMAMPNAKMLLGNHEYMMMNAIGPEPWLDEDREECLELWYWNGGDVTHEYLKHIRKSIRAEIFEYIRSLPLNYDVEVNGIRYKLVHASPAVDFEKDILRRYHDERYFAVWHRQEACMLEPEDHVMVFGHTPTNHFGFDRKLFIWHSPEGHRIGIDCGSGFPKSLPWGRRVPVGRLACLRLDDGKEFYSDEG